MVPMRIALSSAFAALLVSATAVRADNAATGLWIDHTGRGAVEITDCSGKLCGHVAWLKDTENNDQCGKQIIGDVESIGTNKWDHGWIYDPDRGSKYDVAISTIGTDKLKVVGYAGTKWLSETYTWKRASADLQKCSKDGTAAQATPPTAAPKVESAKVDGKADALKTDDKTDTPKTDTAKAATEAIKPAEGGERTDTAKTDNGTPDSTKSASAKSNNDKTDGTAGEEDTADNDKGGKDAGKIVSRIIESLDDSGDEGDGPPKKKGTCKMNVPYVDMVVSYPCDK